MYEIIYFYKTSIHMGTCELNMQYENFHIKVRKILLKKKLITFLSTQSFEMK